MTHVRLLALRLARRAGRLGARWQDEAIEAILRPGGPSSADLVTLEASHQLISLAVALERLAFPRRKVTV